MKETIKSMQAIAEPFLAFLRWEASSGVILLACAILALIVANSPLAESYEHLLHYPIAIGAGEYVLEMGLLHWINDGLMAVFFFVIGLVCVSSVCLVFAVRFCCTFCLCALFLCVI